MTPDNLTPAESRAVRQAAKRMQAYRLRGQVVERRYGRSYRIRGGARRATDPKKAPDRPIEELRERGEIDGAREATLTAMAFRLSGGKEATYTRGGAR